MLKHINEHQPATYEESLSEEKFFSKMKVYQEQIQHAMLEVRNSGGTPRNLHRNVKAALCKDIHDLYPFMKIARYFHLGQGFDADPFLALEISKTLAQGCDGHKYKEFQYFYALLLANHGGNFNSTAHEFMKQLVSENYLPAIARYGTYLETGSLGVSPDLFLAEDYYRRAAKAGHVIGLSLLARINRKKKNVFAVLYGWILTVKLILLLPIANLRMKKRYDDKDTYY